MRTSRYRSKKAFDGPSFIVRLSRDDARSLKHLAKRYTQGNQSEAMRILIRGEMAREIKRTEGQQA